MISDPLYLDCGRRQRHCISDTALGISRYVSDVAIAYGKCVVKWYFGPPMQHGTNFYVPVFMYIMVCMYVCVYVCQ